MALTLEQYMKHYPFLKFSQADIDMGRDNFGALEGIINAKVERHHATTKEAKDAANNKANAIRQQYGGYHGGSDGLQGIYNPQFKKKDNVDALYNKFSAATEKHKAPTYTPRYEAEIAGIMQDLGNRKPFSYDMNKDPLYQQYRDQYIREGRKGMEDTMAQTAAMTGGYGSTYGAVAAQQGYDQYLSRLNDRVPELEQLAYGKYRDEWNDMYNRLGAYQGEENRLYGQYLDALSQSNRDRDFAFNQMQAAMAQNNHDNAFDRGVFESDRDYRVNRYESEEGRKEREEERQYIRGEAAKDRQEREKQLAIENALSIGDYGALKTMGYSTDYLDFLQRVERAKGNALLQEIAMGGSGRSGGGRKKKVGKSSSKKSKLEDKDLPPKPKKDDEKEKIKLMYYAHGKNNGIADGYAKKQYEAGNITEKELQAALQEAGDSTLRNDSILMLQGKKKRRETK